jgi:hypothetical protein
MSGQLESTLVLAIRDSIRWESALDAPTTGTLTPLNPAAPFNALDYQQRDRELANRDLIVGAAIVDTSVQISDVYNYPALKPQFEGPVVKDLPFQVSEITSNGTLSLVRHVKNSSIPWDASRFTDSDLYGRDALIYEILARACQQAFIDPPIGRIDPTGTIFPDVTAWSLAQAQAIRADINAALPLNRDLFKLPDQNLADRDNILATYVATIAQVLKNPFTKALRIYVKVTGPGTDEREPEVFVLTSDNGTDRVWQAEPALSDRNRIIYNITNRTLQWVRESVDEVMVPQIYAMTIPGIDFGQLVTTLSEVPELKDAQFWRQKAGQIVPAGEEIHDTGAYLSFTSTDAANGGTMQEDAASLTAPGALTFTLNGSLSSGAYRVNVLTVPSPRVAIAGAQNVSDTSGTLGGATFDANVASGSIITKQYIVVGGDGIAYNGNGYAAGQVFSGVAGATTYTQISANLSTVRQYAVAFQLPLTPGPWTVTIDYTDLSGFSDGFGIKAQYVANGANAVNVIQDVVAQPFNGTPGDIVSTSVAGFDVDNTGAFSFPIYWTYGTGQLHIRRVIFQSDTTKGHYQVQTGFAGSTAIVDVIGTAYQPDVMRFEFQSSGSLVNPVFSFNWVGDSDMPIKLKQVDVQSFGTFTPTPVSNEFAGWRQECVDRAERVIQQTYIEAVNSFGTNIPTFRDSGSKWSPTATENWMSFVETAHPRLREMTSIDDTLGIANGRQYEVVSGPVAYGTNSYNIGQRFYGDTTVGTGFSGGAVKQVGALVKSRPGHIGKPALIPYGLTYSGNGTVSAYYDTPQSTPMLVSCVPWMIDQGIYVVQDEFWMSDFLVVPTQSRATVVSPPAPPAVSCITTLTTLALPTDPACDNIVGTNDASVRRLSLLFSSDSLLRFVDTSTNTIIASVAHDPFSTNDGNIGCFATSSSSFYWPSFSGLDVYDQNGNFVTTIANPTDTFMQDCTVYSPVQDKLYNFAFNSATSTRHIVILDPNTNTVIGDIDTGVASGGRLSYVPDKLLITYSGFKMVSYTLPAVTVENTLITFNFQAGEIAYATSTGKLYTSINTFATPVSFVEIDPITLTITKTITTNSTNGLLRFFTYNPVTGLIIGMGDGGGTVVFDPVSGNIVCEFGTPNPNFPSTGGFAVDYTSGNVYITEFGISPSLLRVFH